MRPRCVAPPFFGAAFFDWLTDRYRDNLAAALNDGSLLVGTDIDSLAAAFVAFDQGLAIASRSPRQRQTLAQSASALLSNLRQAAVGPPRHNYSGFR